MTKWVVKTVVPVKLPLHACVPVASMTVFPSADLTDVYVVLVGRAVPDTEIDDDAADGAAAANPSDTATRPAIESFLSDRCICPPSRGCCERIDATARSAGKKSWSPTIFNRCSYAD